MTIRSPARIRVAMDDINEGENLDETDTNASVHSGSAHAFSGSDGTRMATATSHYSIHTPCASPVRSEHGFFSSPASAQELTTQEPLTPEDTTREAWDERLRGVYERSPYCEQGPGQWGKLLETELDKKTKSASHFAGMYDIDRPLKEKHELEDQITKKMDAQREFLQDFAFFLAASEVSSSATSFDNFKTTIAKRLGMWWTPRQEEQTERFWQAQRIEDLPIQVLAVELLRRSRERPLKAFAASVAQSKTTMVKLVNLPVRAAFLPFQTAKKVLRFAMHRNESNSRPIVQTAIP
eukprot:GEMP01053464.1.p1 GENE.GEMP01053464.1~~GEMP01053464.1.p1  ORF type:complete len:295 (+),score=79.00 GEMP01053464.1:89-973(+)